MDMEDGFRNDLLVALIAIVGICASFEVAEAQTEDLIVNGGFEEPAIPARSFRVFSSIPGWTILPGSPDFEIQNRVAGDPFEGDQLCELDAFRASTIFQDIPTSPGSVYELSFAFSARPGRPVWDNVLRVFWGGEEITTLAEDGAELSNTSWEVHTFQVFGGPDTTTRLIFEDRGVSNRLGTYIDGVRVVDLGFSITTSIPRYLLLGDPFSLQLEAGGGKAPLVWSLVGTGLPTGLTLGADGVLSGTPSELGQFTFIVRVIDVDGETAEKEFMVEVVLVLPAPDVRISKSGTTPVPGRVLDYFAIVENVGDTTATDVVITEMLEPWFTLVDTSPELSFVTEAVDPFPEDPVDPSYEALIGWTLPTLEPGEVAVLSYRVELDPEFPIGEAVAGPMCISIPTLPEADACSEKYFTCLAVAASKCLIVPGPGPLYPACMAKGGATCGAKYFLCMGKAAFWCDKEDGTSTRPFDPNEKLVVAERFIQPDETLVYPIHFENIGDVEALDVFITDVLDLDLDLDTVEIFTPGASLDPDTRTLRWELLERNLEPGETDNVLFSVRPVSGLTSGTEIRNKAEIQFEIFDPLITPEVVNVIDTTPPSCTMDPLPSESTAPVPITWTGSDAIGEIESFSIFVSEDGAVFEPFLENTTDTERSFAGEVGKRYEFFCVAKDTAGNVEPQATEAETVTLVSASSLETITSVSAASFLASTAVAAESIASGFGQDLAPGMEVATSRPLPTALGGTAVLVKDSARVERPAPLFFVSKEQINYLVPAGTAIGPAKVTVINEDLPVATGTLHPHFQFDSDLPTFQRP